MPDKTQLMTKFLPIKTKKAPSFREDEFCMILLSSCASSFINELVFSSNDEGKPSLSPLDACSSMLERIKTLSG